MGLAGLHNEYVSCVVTSRLTSDEIKIGDINLSRRLIQVNLPSKYNIPPLLYIEVILIEHHLAIVPL